MSAQLPRSHAVAAQRAAATRSGSRTVHVQGVLVLQDLALEHDLLLLRRAWWRALGLDELRAQSGRMSEAMQCTSHAQRKEGHAGERPLDRRALCVSESRRVVSRNELTARSIAAVRQRGRSATRARGLPLLPPNVIPKRLSPPVPLHRHRHPPAARADAPLRRQPRWPPSRSRRQAPASPSASLPHPRRRQRQQRGPARLLRLRRVARLTWSSSRPW